MCVYIYTYIHTYIHTSIHAIYHALCLVRCIGAKPEILGGFSRWVTGTSLFKGLHVFKLKVT